MLAPCISPHPNIHSFSSVIDTLRLIHTISSWIVHTCLQLFTTHDKSALGLKSVLLGLKSRLTLAHVQRYTCASLHIEPSVHVA